MEAALGRVMSTDEITEGRLTLTAPNKRKRTSQTTLFSASPPGFLYLTRRALATSGPNEVGVMHTGKWIKTLRGDNEQRELPGGNKEQSQDSTL